MPNIAVKCSPQEWQLWIGGKYILNTEIGAGSQQAHSEGTILSISSIYIYI